MRTLLASLFAALLVVPAGAEPTKPIDRQRLLAHLAMTESWLASELAGFDARAGDASAGRRQLAHPRRGRTPGDRRAPCWKMVQDSMQQPSAGTIEATDADILWYGIDRTQRSRTGEAREPKGKQQGRAVGALFEDFRALRVTIRNFATDNQNDLRGRKLAGGNMSVYQWLLMISTHSAASHPADQGDQGERRFPWPASSHRVAGIRVSLDPRRSDAFAVMGKRRDGGQTELVIDYRLRLSTGASTAGWMLGGCGVAIGRRLRTVSWAVGTTGILQACR